MKNKKPTDWIPKNWTFESGAVASRFDAHVREQLPWYDVLTDSVVHVAAHYIPEGGLVYDIGASTGNLGRALKPYLKDRKARLISIEKSAEMAARWKGMGELLIKDALDVGFKEFDLAVCMLTLMFIPVAKRASFVGRLAGQIRPGGALIVVDKVISAEGYPGTVLRRLAMKWKMEGGTSAEEIVAKELSLGGVQRPIDPRILPSNAIEFFRFGEFAGWIIERPEIDRNPPASFANFKSTDDELF